jgi:hypothetical protein
MSRMKPELPRLKAEFALKRHQVGDEAERCLMEALSVARQHGIRWFELRAARTLAGQSGERVGGVSGTALHLAGHHHLDLMLVLGEAAEIDTSLSHRLLGWG